jgi:hypothetical protein
MDEIDEVALNTMLADGVDLPTAVVGSVKDPQPARDWPQVAGAIAGAIVLGVIWWLFA